MQSSIMKRDKAYYFLTTVFDEIKKSHPEVKFNTYRDGGSVSFSIPTEKYDNIILLAPVTRLYNSRNPKTSEVRIDHIDILKPGCARFEDSYRTENIRHTFSIEDEKFSKEDASVIVSVLQNIIYNIKTCAK